MFLCVSRLRALAQLLCDVLGGRTLQWVIIELHQFVIDELEFEPSIDATNIGGAADEESNESMTV